MQKYFVVQGLAAGQNVYVVSERARQFLEECMWLPGGNASTATSPSHGPSTTPAEDEEDENAKKHDAKIKIAWRYEQMKQFQTTVSSSTQYVVSSGSTRRLLLMLILTMRRLDLQMIFVECST